MFHRSCPVLDTGSKDTNNERVTPISTHCRQTGRGSSSGPDTTFFTPLSKRDQPRGSSYGPDTAFFLHRYRRGTDPIPFNQPRISVGGFGDPSKFRFGLSRRTPFEPSRETEAEEEVSSLPPRGPLATLLTFPVRQGARDVTRVCARVCRCFLPLQ